MGRKLQPFRHSGPDPSFQMQKLGPQALTFPGTPGLLNPNLAFSHQTFPLHS